MKVDNIRKIFENYLETEKSQFAILINGTWGCGKTYLWKYDLAVIAKEKGFKPIYISLNGISKIEQIDYTLFIKLLPWINKQENKAIKNLTALFANTLNHLSKLFLHVSLTETFKGISDDSFNFSKYIICFDDLERCQTPIKEVLGFINNYVEHKGLKTIILADENNLISNEEKGYDNIKEKVIGRIINYEPAINEIVPEFLKIYKSDKQDFHFFLKEWQEYITIIINELNISNLRIITFYLSVLDQIYPCLNNVEEKYIKEIIFFSAIISIEFKSGVLKTSEYCDTKGISNIDEHFSIMNQARLVNKNTEKEVPVEKTYVQLFCEKYLNKRANEYFFYNSIYSFILTGFLDQQMFKDEIKKRYPELVSQEIKEFRKLLNYKFRELDNKDFMKLTENVITYAKNGVYSIYDYVQIANFYYFFINSNLISLSKEYVDNVITVGLDIAKKRKETNNWMVDNMLHFSDENPDVTTIKHCVKNIHNEIKIEEHKRTSKNLISLLEGDDEKSLTMFFNDNRFSRELLKYLDNTKFLLSIISLNNRRLFNFTELLADRYSPVNIGEFLHEDRERLIDLKEKLDIYLSEKNDLGQPKLFLLYSLQKELVKIVNHLDRSSKK
jgi:hypothetical protein